MQKILLLLASMIFVFSSPAIANEKAPGLAMPQRSVAITIDDLPVQRGRNLQDMQQTTTALLQSIQDLKLPVTGFVNEAQIHAGGEGEVAARTALLQQWLQAGLELGNHTYSHPDMNTTPLDAFIANVLKGEQITRGLMGEQDSNPRYFRHPFLRTGLDLSERRDFENFLKENGYTIAPVTIDNSEWIYAFAYNRAAEQGDKALMQRIGADYLLHMEAAFANYEQLSRDVLKRELPQILLIHANRLNADYLKPLVNMMKARGYNIVPLEQALKDKTYARQDDYLGGRGISWLERWALADGIARPEEPPVPAYVQELAR